MKSVKRRSEPEKQNMTTARTRLKGILKDLSEPNDNQSDNDEKDDTPTKSNLPSKGRPPKSIKIEKKNDKETFIMKLFDRSVDFARYTENSCLYPICREWIRDKPNQRFQKKKRPIPRQRKSNIIIDIHDDITELPAPNLKNIKRTPKLLAEQGNFEKTKFDLINESKNPKKNRNELLADHKLRWSKIRKTWIDQSKLHREQFAESLNILEQILFK